MGEFSLRSLNVRSISIIVVFVLVIVAWGGEAVAAPPTVEAFAIQGLFDRDMIKGEIPAITGFISTSGGKTKAAALNDRGIRRYLLGEHRAAISDFTAAIELEKLSAYYSNRGMPRRAIGELDEAKRDYEAAVRGDPGNVFAHNNLGWLLLLEARAEDDEKTRDEKIERAGEYLKKARTLAEAQELKMPLLHSNIAAWYLLRGKVDKADGELGTAKQMVDAWNRRKPVIAMQCMLLNMGEAARCKGHWDKARARYKEAYELGRNNFVPPPAEDLSAGPDESRENPWILQRLGVAEFVLGDYRKAKEHLELAARRFGPKHDLARRYAGLLAAVADAHLQGVAAAAVAVRDKTPASWIDALELYMAGRLSDDQLRSAAEDKNAKAAGAKQCEMYYYMARKKLLEKKLREAGNLLEKCRESREETRLERTMAREVSQP